MKINDLFDEMVTRPTNGSVAGNVRYTKTSHPGHQGEASDEWFQFLEELLDGTVVAYVVESYVTPVAVYVPSEDVLYVTPDKHSSSTSSHVTAARKSTEIYGGKVVQK